MKKKYIVTLTVAERRMLQEMLSRGKAAARKLMHARVLLKADAAPDGPGWGGDAIADGVDVGRATVERLRKEFVEEGLDAALERRKPRRCYGRRLGGTRRREHRLRATASPQDNSLDGLIQPMDRQDSNSAAQRVLVPFSQRGQLPPSQHPVIAEQRQEFDVVVAGLEGHHAPVRSALYVICL